MPNQLTKTQFDACLNQEFRITIDSDNSVQVTLVESSALGGDSLRESGESFSLVFHGEAEPFLEQGMYAVKNDGFGSAELFLVPLGPDRERGGMRYEAVFS